MKFACDDVKQDEEISIGPCSGSNGLMLAKRDLALDGLRGVAALSVALGHCVLAITGHAVWGATIFDFPTKSLEEITYRLLYVLFPSDAAVTLFFVLSGHVLWESFSRRAAGLTGFPSYISSRCYRLMPVVIATAIPLGLLSDASSRELVENMLLLSNSLNGPLWSLQVEAICSVAIFGVWILVRHSVSRLVAVLVMVTAISPLFRGSNFFLFFPAFLLGALIGSLPTAVFGRKSVPAVGVFLLVLTSLFLSHSSISRPFEMLGAMIVVTAARVQAPAFLTSRAILFLGAISYPFYLSHTVGLLLVQRFSLVPDGISAFGQIALISLYSVLFTIIIAWIIHRTVEIPFQKLSVRPRPDAVVTHSNIVAVEPGAV